MTKRLEVLDAQVYIVWKVLKQRYNIYVCMMVHKDFYFHKKIDHVVLTTLRIFFSRLIHFVKLFCKHYKRIRCLLSINKSKSEEFTYDEEVFAVVELFDCHSETNIFVYFFILQYYFCLYYLTIFHSNVPVMNDLCIHIGIGSAKKAKQQKKFYL